MWFRSNALPLMLLHFGLLGMAPGVKGQEEVGYLQPALRALGFPDAQPRLYKNQTSALLSVILKAVRCPERTGTTQELCDKVSNRTLFDSIC